MNGKLVQLDIVPGNARIVNNPPDEGALDIEFSDASGLFSGMRKRRKQRQARRDLRVKSKAQARLYRNKAKIEQAKAQQIAAQSMGKTEGDVALAQAIASGEKSGKSKKGLSTGAKVGIGLAVLAVLGVATYFIINSRKGKLAKVKAK